MQQILDLQKRCVCVIERVKWERKDKREEAREKEIMEWKDKMKKLN